MTAPAESRGVNADEIEYWNTGPGAKWVAYQGVLDACFVAVKERLLERAAPAPGERVLDIGCGAGATTLDLAIRVGPKGRVLGADVAKPLLQKAEERAARAGLGNARFVRADAQVHAFDPGIFDLMASRFGVMFFSDPVAAFANIARALRRGGRIAFVSWAGIEHNPWFKIPSEAAIARLGNPEPTPPNAPGPMAFQDPARVTDILSKAGLAQASAEAEDLDLTIPGTLDEAAEFATNLGPIARIVREKGGGPDDLAAIARDLSAKLSDYAVEGGLRVPARLIFYSALKP